MSLKQTVSGLLQPGHHPVPAAASASLSVLAAVAVGGVVAGMPLPDILVCGLVASGGVGLFCAVAALLFDARFRRSRQSLNEDDRQGEAPSPEVPILVRAGHYRRTGRWEWLR
jgi:hypothetical protein